MGIEKPAYRIDEAGRKIWYLKSKGERHFHNPDGPALIFTTGYKAWYIDGECHRTDGPAVCGAQGSERWYVNGKKLPEKEVEQWIKENNIDLSTEEGEMAFILRWA